VGRSRRSGERLCAFHTLSPPPKCARQGHAKQLLALDFSPNGYHLASGSDDNTAIVWELRQQRALYTIPAHRALVKCVKYAPRAGEVLVTASYDGSIRAWSGRDFSPIVALRGHENKVAAVAIADGGRAAAQLLSRAAGGGGGGGGNEEAGSVDAATAIVSASFDRTVKVWG